MQQAHEDLLVKADEFERMAELASSEVLRCRYRSMARYWSILAGEVEQRASLHAQTGGGQQKSLDRAA